MSKIVERFVVQHSKTKKFLDVVLINNKSVPIWKDEINQAKFFGERHPKSFFRTLNNNYFDYNDVDVKAVEIYFKIEN